MKIIDYTKECTKKENDLPAYYRHYFPNAKLLFFDIETTGFVAKNTTLYLIGVLWYEKDCLQIKQWFNADGKSEAEILTEFQEFCKSFTHLVHFNGLGFDIPYLKQKAYQLQIPFTLENQLKQIDIYKMIRSYKNILTLNSMKQVSIENYLGIARDDTCSGKELIEVYKRYITNPDSKAEALILLHNHDDLLGMPSISKILNVKAFFEKIEITEVNMKTEENRLLLSFSYHASASLPKRLSLTRNNIYLNGIEETATLYLPILYGELKHYFTDYKNYYYLPKEDLAIHKSIAAYVEPENKKKATKDTCYIRKEDFFIPCPDPAFEDSFKINPSDKKLYQTLEELTCGDISLQKNYIKNTLRIFL